MSTLSKLLESFTRFRADSMPSDREGLPLVDKDEEVVTKMDSSDQRVSTISQLNEFRTIAEDRETQYNTYDEMSTDSVIAAALELYADDATAYDEQGRIIWVESEEQHIADAGNMLLDKLNIPERAWKHIYQACKYGDYYLKLYRKGEDEDRDPISTMSGGSVKVINDVVEEKGSKLIYPYDMYVEDVYDPGAVFDLRKRGKTAGFIEVSRDLQNNTVYTSANVNNVFMLKDVNVYKPDRMVHIMISENLTRTPETVTITFDEDKATTYEVARGKSILYDVYPIQRELQLLEDSLLLNRLTRSSLIRLLEIEVGDMPKKEVNDYLRRMKNLIEQHIAMDKNSGSYKSYNSPGPIDNVIYIPVKNGKGHIDINNLGGDVNVRDIADIDYFNNKRSGALKIPRSFLGDNGEGCLRGSTEVLLLNGQRRGIGYLYEHRDEYIGKGIMSCNSDGSLLPTKIKDIKQTRKDAKFVRVHLDNGKYFDVTPDHLCMLRDGSFREAQDLEVGSSLMPMYDRVQSGRRYVWDNLEEVWYAQYRLVAVTKYGELKKGHQVHHINEIKIDDDFSNLEQLTVAEHYQKHSEVLHNKANRSLAEHRSEDPQWWEDVNRRRSESLKGRPKSETTKRKISQALSGKSSNHPFESGSNNPVYSITYETRKKISEANSDRVRVNNGEVELHIKIDDVENFLVDNPDYQVGVLPSTIQKYQDTVCTKRRHKLQSWINEKHTCETCGKVMTEYYGSGRFCSPECSRKHICSDETRAKISQARRNDSVIRRFVNNGSHELLIDEEHLTEFLSENTEYEIGRLPVTDQARAKRSKAVSGENNPCYGKKKVNNGVSQRFIPRDEVEKFLEDNPDWELGGLKKSAPYNHKVVQVEFLDVVEDAYDLQVESDNHTFLLSSGVFVHNSQLDNGGTLTQLSIRYARTIKRIQTSYISAITTLLNLFFIDMDLDYINKFQVRMTSPSTQEDIARNELINGNIDLISSIMSLTESLEGDTQKEILEYLINNVLKMPEIADIISEDTTPEEDIMVDGDMSGGGDFGGPDIDIDLGGGDDFEAPDTSVVEPPDTGAGGTEGPEFTADEYASFEDEL